MTVVTLRPNGTDHNDGALTGGASAHAVLSDNSDASYVTLGFFDQVEVNLTDLSLPGGAVLRALAVRLRVAGTSSPYVACGIGGLMELDPEARVSWTTPATLQVGPQVFSGVGVWPFYDATTITDALLDAATLRITGKSAIGNVKAYEAYLDVMYVETPTINVTAPAGTVTTTNVPVVSWTDGLDADGGPQTSATIKIFSAAQYGQLGFDPDTSTPLQLLTVSGAATSQVAAAALSEGDYRAYVRTSQTVNGAALTSDWDHSAFEIDVDGPAAPSLLATPDPDHARIRLDITENVGGAATTDAFEVQRSVDAGRTWAPVRTPSGDDGVVAGTSARIYDYEAPLGVPVTYRGRALHYYGAAVAAGDWRSIFVAPVNLASDPSFELGALGDPWVEVAGTWDLVGGVGLSLAGPTSARATASGDRPILAQTIALEDGGDYTVTAYCKTAALVTAGGAALNLDIVSGSGATVDSISLTGTHDWTLLVARITNALAGTVVAVQLDVGFGATATGVAYFDAVMCNPGLDVLTYFDGSAAGYGWLGEPNASPSARYIDPINLMPEPSFELGLGTWTVFDGDWEAVTGVGLSLAGPTSARAVASSDRPILAYFLTLDEGGDWTFSVWCKTNAITHVGGVSLNIEISSGSGTVTDSAQLTGTNDWTILVARIENAAPGTIVGVNLDVGTGSTGNGTAYFDSCMAVRGLDVLGYFDGDVDGYAWIGEPHASPSGILAAVTLDTDTWWLKHPNQPSLNVAFNPRSYKSVKRAARVGMAQPLGATRPVVISDTRASDTGSITMLVADHDALATLDVLLNTTATLLLQGPSSHDEPDRHVCILDRDAVRIVDNGNHHERDVTMDWVEVAAPAGAYA